MIAKSYFWKCFKQFCLSVIKSNIGQKRFKKVQKNKKNSYKVRKMPLLSENTFYQEYITIYTST